MHVAVSDSVSGDFIYIRLHITIERESNYISCLCKTGHFLGEGHTLIFITYCYSFVYSGAANVRAAFDPLHHVGLEDIVVLRTPDPEPEQKMEPYWVAKVTKVRPEIHIPSYMFTYDEA